MNLERFFIYSSAAHILVFAALLFLVPAEQEKKSGGDFITRLVSPDEMTSPRRPSLPVPKIQAPPAVPQRPARAAPSPPPGTRDKGRSDDDREGRSVQPAPLSSRPGNEQTGSIPSRESFGQKGIPAPVTPQVPLREKLFDKDVIGDLAKREVEKKEREKKDTSFSFDAREYKFFLYNRRLKERIESIWVYPPEAAARGIYGDLILRFTIKKDGKIGAIELVRTSGHKNLDDYAMRALRDGSPYWPLPEEWGMDSYTIEGHFVYTIYGYYIR